MFCIAVPTKWASGYMSVSSTSMTQWCLAALQRSHAFLFLQSYVSCAGKLSSLKHKAGVCLLGTPSCFAPSKVPVAAMTWCNPCCLSSTCMRSFLIAISYLTIDEACISGCAEPLSSCPAECWVIKRRASILCCFWTQSHSKRSQNNRIYRSIRGMSHSYWGSPHQPAVECGYLFTSQLDTFAYNMHVAGIYARYIQARHRAQCKLTCCADYKTPLQCMIVHHGLCIHLLCCTHKQACKKNDFQKKTTCQWILNSNVTNMSSSSQQHWPLVVSTD